MHRIKRWCILNFLVTLTLFYFVSLDIQRLKLNELRIPIFNSDGLQKLVPQIGIPSPLDLILTDKRENISYPPETFLSTVSDIRIPDSGYFTNFLYYSVSFFMFVNLIEFHPAGNYSFPWLPSGRAQSDNEGRIYHFNISHLSI